MSRERRLPIGLCRAIGFGESVGVIVNTRLLEITDEGEVGGPLEGSGNEGGGELGGGGGERLWSRSVRNTRNRGSTVRMCL